MTQQETEFLDRAVIRQEKYKDIATAMQFNEKQLSIWWESLKTEREELARIRKLWITKCDSIEFWQFHKWYTQTERKCHYCALDEETIAQLIAAHQICTKRITTRGRSLEIDRKRPNEAYDNTENLVWCCYWCNNAKTDEFTEEEFMKIGRIMTNIWSNRINKTNDK